MPFVKDLNNKILKFLFTISHFLNNKIVKKHDKS